MSKIIIFVSLLMSMQSYSYAHTGHTNLVFDGPDLPLEVSKQYKSPAHQKLKVDCNGGNKQNCVQLGVLYYTGQDKEITKNIKTAQEFFNKACNKKSPMGCFYLAFTHLRGGDGVKKSDKKAMYDFARGCHLGNMRSCDQYRILEEG